MVTKKWDFPLLSFSCLLVVRPEVCETEEQTFRTIQALARRAHEAEGLRAGSHCQCTAQADRSVQSSQGRLGCAEARTQAAACDFSCCPAGLKNKSSSSSLIGYRWRSRLRGTEAAATLQRVVGLTPDLERGVARAASHSPLRKQKHRCGARARRATFGECRVTRIAQQCLARLGRRESNPCYRGTQHRTEQNKRG